MCDKHSFRLLIFIYFFGTENAKSTVRALCAYCVRVSVLSHTRLTQEQRNANDASAASI